jgi:hypothetical protein
MFGREWLNLPNHNTTASIVTKVNVDKEYKDDKLVGMYLGTTFNISDCDRKIALDFAVNNQENYDNSIYKLDTLINNIRKFKSGIIKARAIQLEVDKNNKKLNKPSK